VEARIFGNGIRFDSDRLRHQMRIRAISGKALAAAAGLTGPTLSQACLGRTISAKTAHRIADALAALPIKLGEDLLAS